MKRKFISMMVAACAALFSFTGLTGCGGGGGDEESKDGIMTVQDFVDSKKMFIIKAGLYFDLAPLSGTSWVNATEVDKQCYVKFEDGNGYEPMVTYRVTPRAGQTGADAEPSSATLEITFGSHQAISDQNVLDALGLPGATSFVGTIKVQLDYTSPGIGGRVLSMARVQIYDGTSVTIPINVEQNGRFIVDRNQYQ